MTKSLALLTKIALLTAGALGAIHAYLFLKGYKKRPEPQQHVSHGQVVTAEMYAELDAILIENEQRSANGHL